MGRKLEVEFTDFDKCSEFKRAKSNWFYLERDGSIGGHNTEGVEIITIPLRPQDAKSSEFWRDGLTSRIADHALSWDTCGRCGLHVHVGNERLGGHPLTIQENQAKLIYFHEHFLKDLPLTESVYGRSRSYSEMDGRTDHGAEFSRVHKMMMKDRKKQEELKEATLNGRNINYRYHAISIPNRGDLTDSETFFRDYFIPVFRHGGWFEADRLIRDVIGYSKFVFMDNKGNIRHYGDYIKDADGVLYSNSSFRRHPYSYYLKG